MKLLKRLFGVGAKQPPIHIRPDKPTPKPQVLSEEEIHHKEDLALEAILLNDTMGLPFDEEGKFILPEPVHPSLSPLKPVQSVSFPTVYRSPINRTQTESTKKKPREVPEFTKKEEPKRENVWSLVVESGGDGRVISPCKEVSRAKGKIIATCILPSGHTGNHKSTEGTWADPIQAHAPIIINKHVNRPITGRADLEEVKEKFRNERKALKDRQQRELKIIEDLIDKHFPESS